MIMAFICQARAALLVLRTVRFVQLQTPAVCVFQDTISHHPSVYPAVKSVNPALLLRPRVSAVTTDTS